MCEANEEYARVLEKQLDELNTCIARAKQSIEHLEPVFHSMLKAYIDIVIILSEEEKKAI